nr:MAG TPA: tail protein [Caudoviricetes sp.]
MSVQNRALFFLSANFGCVMVDIKDISGKTRFSTPINVGAKGRFTLMKEDYIILPFSVPNPVYFKLGDYVDLSGVLDESLGGLLSKVYEIVDLQKPAFNASTGGYDYKLRMDAYYWKWKNKIFKYTPEHAGHEASWSLTAPLDVQLGVFLRNLKALGYTYKGKEFEFRIDSTVENKAVAMRYDNMNLLDALFSMADKEKWDCDCWITDNIIHFGRNEYGDSVRIELGVEASAMTRSDSKGTYATRIYAFGSTRNIPADYRPVDEQTVVNGVVQRRLMLPADTPYIDVYPDMSEEEAIEDIVVFENVYPRRTGTLSDVHTRTEEVKDENGTKETVTYYRYKDTGLEFKDEYLIEGQELRIRFQSGKLNGMEFGVIFNPDPKDDMRGAQLWEIVRNEDYGRMLPDDTLRPENGDEYVLSGFNIQLVSDRYTPEAEQELKGKAQEYADRRKRDDGTYNTTLDSEWVYNDRLRRFYEFGQKVFLVNRAFFENGRDSRILGWKFNLDKPWDSPAYIIGESMPYSRIGDMEDKIDSLTYKGQTYTSGGNGVYIIRTNDTTAPSDSNVFSARRSLVSFLRKDKSDKTEYLLKLLAGGEFGEFVDSMIAGKGAGIFPDGRGQFERLEVRGSLSVLDLIINQIQGMESDYSFTEIGKIESVEDLGENTYRLKIEKRTDFDFMKFQENDVCFSIINTLLTGGSDYYTSWMRILATNAQENSITVVLYPDSEVPGGTNYPPLAGYNVTRRGNSTLPETGGFNERAQSWMISSREGRIMFLANVFKPILEDYNYALTIGKLPNIKALEKLPVTTEDVGIVAQTVIAEKFYQFDYNGDVIPSKVDRGVWSLETAQSGAPYRFVQHELSKPSGSEYTLLEQHTVYHLGCKWGCLKDKTTDEPKWNSPSWGLLEGDSRYSLQLSLSGGEAFVIGGVDTVMSGRVFYGTIDITDDVMADDATEVEWFRNSGNVPADNLWTPEYVDGNRLAIHIDNGNQHGVGSDFGFVSKSVIFTCRVFFPVNGRLEEVDKNLGFDIL